MTVRVLDDLVLVVRDLRLEVVADAGEQVAGQVEHVARAQELVVGAVEGDLDLVREDLGPALDLDHVVDDAANGVPHRRQRPPDVEQVVRRCEIRERVSAAGLVSTPSSTSSISSSRSSIRSR
jgi:hypothetical protein